MSRERADELGRANVPIGNRARWGRNDVHFQHRALEVIGYGEDSRFARPFEHAAIDAGRPRAARYGVLAELGPIPGDDDLIALAPRVCEARTTCRAALALIHRWRFGPSPSGSTRQLSGQLARSVAGCPARHPDTDSSGVLRALAAVSASIEDEAETGV